MDIERLKYLANQIAWNLEVMEHDEAVAVIASMIALAYLQSLRLRSKNLSYCR